MKSKRILMTIFITTISVPFARGDEVTSLESCRSEIYSRLIGDNKVLSALAVKLSKSAPQECEDRHQELTRFSLIESVDYADKATSDRKYRQTLNRRIAELQSDSMPRAELSGFNSIGKSAAFVSESPQLEAVKGYVNLTGSN